MSIVQGRTPICECRILAAPSSEPELRRADTGDTLSFYLQHTDLQPGERLLAVHVKDGGEMEIRLPRRAKVVKDLFSGRAVCEGADEFRHSFAAPDTSLFGIEWEQKGEK